jgi:hypothetical protein
MAERLETGAVIPGKTATGCVVICQLQSGRRRVDRRNPDHSRKAVLDLEGFYDAADKLW